MRGASNIEFEDLLNGVRSPAPPFPAADLPSHATMEWLEADPDNFKHTEISLVEDFETLIKPAVSEVEQIITCTLP
jgi:hypothetical protein